MGRFKQRGGSFLPNIGLPDNGIGWTIFILAILLPLAGLIALLGFPLHWYDKLPSVTNTVSYSNIKSLLSDNLSVSLTTPKPKNCSADKVGCIPTGVTIGVSPSSSKFNPAGSYLLVWKGQGFYEDNGEAFQKNGSVSVGKTNATNIDIDTGRQITGMSGSIYMKTADASSTGPVASFSYKSPGSTRH